MGVLLACLLASSASAQLTIHRSVKDPALFQQVYDRAPARVRQTPVTLRMNPPGMTEGAFGSYWVDYPNTGRLIGLSRQRDLVSFAHELGHHFASTAMSTEEAQSWRAFYRKHKRLLPKPPPGSRDRPVDGAWAHTFAFWLLNKPLKPEVKAELDRYFLPR